MATASSVEVVGMGAGGGEGEGDSRGGLRNQQTAQTSLTEGLGTASTRAARSACYMGLEPGLF